MNLESWIWALHKLPLSIASVSHHSRWCVPVIPALGKQALEDQEVEASLGYISKLITRAMWWNLVFCSVGIISPTSQDCFAFLIFNTKKSFSLWLLHHLTAHLTYSLLQIWYLFRKTSWEMSKFYSVAVIKWLVSHVPVHISLEAGGCSKTQITFQHFWIRLIFWWKFLHFSKEPGLKHKLQGGSVQIGC